MKVEKKKNVFKTCIIELKLKKTMKNERKLTTVGFVV